MIRLFEATAAEKAKQLGLVYAGWGTWNNKQGIPAAKTQAGKLVMIQKNPVAKQPTTDTSNILGKKVGAQKGSNPGGMYLGNDGVKRYVKFYDDPSKAHAEHLVNTIYTALGIGAPKSTTFDKNGHVGYASDIVSHKGQLSDISVEQRKQIANKILDGFAADVLLANWDAVGLEDDNVVIGQKGIPIRIDNGGSLLFRAQAGRKPKELLRNIPEWNGFTDPNVNGSYAQIFRDAGYRSPNDILPRIKQQVARIVQLRKQYGGWDQLIKSVTPTMNADDARTITAMLDARLKKIIQKVSN